MLSTTLAKKDHKKMKIHMNIVKFGHFKNEVLAVAGDFNRFLGYMWLFRED